MTKDPMKQLVETIGAGSLAAHICTLIVENQRAIAEHYAGVDGMQYPGNLLGEMEQLLSARNPRAIKEKIGCWRRWIDDTARIQKMLERTLILIEAFVIFYQAENGDTNDING